jgi:hypothetical protein
LGVLSNGLYVVKADITIFHRLANLRGGTIELRPRLVLHDRPAEALFDEAGGL